MKKRFAVANLLIFQVYITTNSEKIQDLFRNRHGCKKYVVINMKLSNLPAAAGELIAGCQV